MNKTKGILFSVIAASIFGFVAAVSPIAYQGGFNPVTLALMRQLVNLPLALIIMLVNKTPLKLKSDQTVKLSALGIFGWAATILTLNTAYTLVDVGICTTIHFTYPIFVTLGCVLIYKVRIGRVKIMALAVSTLGIVALVLGGTGSSSNATGGIFLALVSGVTYAFYMLFLDKSNLASQMSPVKVIFYVGLSGCSVLALYGLLTGQLNFSGIEPKYWLMVVGIGILGGLVGFSLVQLGIKHTDATTTSICSTCEPVTSVLFGILLLGEQFTVMKLIASVLIIAGVLMLSLIKEKKKPSV